MDAVHADTPHAAQTQPALRWRGWLALGAVDSAAHSMNSLGPFVVGGLIEDLHLSQGQLGVWSMTEMLAYAGAMFLVAPRAGRLSLPVLAVGAAALAGAAQLVSAFATSFILLLALRLATGVGFGLLNTAVNVFAARTGEPNRAISFAMAMQTVLYVGMGFVLPVAGRLGGRTGMFLMLGLLVLLLAPLMLLQPAGIAAPREAPRRVGAGDLSKRTPWPPLARMLPMLGAMALFTFGDLAVWPFTERIGHAVGLDRAVFGEMVSLANLLGLGACIAGGFVGLRFGRRAPALLYLLASGVACLMQANPAGPDAFAIAFVANYALWFLSYPALIGAACAIDPVGRLPTLCTAVWLIAQAAGALVAGWAGDHGATGAVGWLGLACCCGAALLFLAVGE